MDSRIGVVVPTFNRDDLLRETLNSLVEQARSPDEIIVVDDGSTDHTADVVAAVRHQSVRYLKIGNGGPLRARNLGLQATSCELVGFCDSDDLWQPELLQTAAELWSRAPNLVASYTNFSTVVEDRKVADSKCDVAPANVWDAAHPVAPGLAVLEASFSSQLIDYQPFFPTGMIVRRDLFLEMGGWDEGVAGHVGSDLATAMRVCEHPPIGLIQRPLAVIRKHQSNISGDTERMNLGNARVLEYVLATRPAMQQMRDTIMASVASRRRDALASAFVRHDLSAVRDIYRLLPAREQPPAIKLKALVAALPLPLAAIANQMALWLGTSKAAVMAMML